MKKLLSMLLAAILIFGAVSAAAEGFQDLAAMYSDEDLKMILAVIRAELIRRSGEGFTLQPGVYIVGTDFPACAYRVELTGEGYANFEAYANDNSFSSGFSFYSTFMDSATANVIGRIYLSENNIVAPL